MFDFKTFNSPAALKDNICFYTLDLSWLTCNFAWNKQIDKYKNWFESFCIYDYHLLVFA